MLIVVGLTPACTSCAVIWDLLAARPTAEQLLKHHWFADAAEGRLTLGKYRTVLNIFCSALRGLLQLAAGPVPAHQADMSLEPAHTCTAARVFRVPVHMSTCYFAPAATLHR